MSTPKTDRLQELKSEIIEKYKSGNSLDSLAATYMVNPSTIRRFLISHTVSLRPAIRPYILQKHKVDVISLYRSGCNTKILSDRFKVDRNTISHFLKINKVRRKVGLRQGQFSINADTDKGMLAGLLLGEGSIIIRGKSARITICNQESAIIGWLGQFGGTIHWSKPRKGCINPCAVWHLSRAVDVFHCLSILLPLLVGKKKSLAVAALNVLKHSYNFQL